MEPYNKRFVISVLGTDGSGKSTIINAVTPWLEKTFSCPVAYHHLRPSCLPDLGVLLGKKRAPRPGEEPIVVTDPHSRKPSGFVGSLFRWGYYLVDYTYGYWRKVGRTSGGVFIFDRYYYDYYIDQRRTATSLPRWVIRLGEFVVPAPDVILCLGGNPEAIYSRKPETSLEEVTRQTEALRAFCRQHARAVWIDATMAPEESIAAAKAVIGKFNG